MIKPSWDIFRAKFTENPQENFEWFCYLLFCKELKKEFGVFRYINQAAIETEPVEAREEVIGWQAKFYDVSLSDRKDAILTTLEKSKKYYPTLTKLIFYTNQEWGQAKGKKPQGLIDIEKKAKDLNIILEWRTASFFESEFVVSDNQLISKHFFSLEKSIVDLLQEQRQHTKNILNDIHTYILFNEQYIEIKRTNYVEKLKKSLHKVSVLSGIGGVGKTVVIKNLYERIKEDTPFFVFKATEFELRHINDLFNGFTLYNFIEVHKEQKKKIIVIDSAEKILDLKNTDPFKEFLSVLIKNGWQLIFTTRNHYLENLYADLSEIYKIVPLSINIEILDFDELESLSETYSFSLPKDEKLLNLIKNPFYLNSYLQNFTELRELNYSDFKSKLWNKKIKTSKPAREICFIQIAHERANSGQFFVRSSCESNILDELIKDGILGYELSGYFITHDIYEEWALEKIIEIEFLKMSDEVDFFEKIGQSLAIRRSFRNWISEKLLLEDENIKTFIEGAIANEVVAQFWKDELFVSILLSDYSKVFFELFKDELLANEQELLKRITFILRMTCKDVDNDFFLQLGIKNLDIFSLEYVLTKPKGEGWVHLINFIFDNIDTIGIKNINFILPIVYDWNNKITHGETTRLSSLIALKFYQWTIKEDVYYSREDTKKDLFKTIINGSSEIIDELANIFDEVLKNEWKNHSEPYSDFIEFILTKLEAFPITKSHPSQILQLVDLFWTCTPKKDYEYYRSSIEVEQYFGLENNRLDYYPASAYQTPIYGLLKSNLKETIDFILEFINKTTEKYVSSGFDNYIGKVNVYIDGDTIQEQYISHCLWNMYRGTGSPVSPYLLQSIHMALEKYFLEIGKVIEATILEKWLLYLLKNSTSTSITSVVTSIVLAYPDKTFNIAQILFRTKEFIQEDTSRLVADRSAESLYSIGRNMGARTNEILENERILTCQDKHREFTLESLCLQYQFFRNENVSEEESLDRQKKCWDILDTYYNELSEDTKGEEFNKTWRLYLARMDKRKMNPITEKTEGGVLINFNPELESDLKEFSENALSQNTESLKYISLKMWSEYKFKNDEKSKEYTQYENNPTHALQEVKDILDKLNEISSTTEENYDDENFRLFNRFIPIFVCSVLIRDYEKDLEKESLELCRQVILETVIFSLHPSYQYQISDGVQQGFSVLHILFDMYSEDRDDIKLLLLFGLLKREHVGGMLDSESFNIFSIMAIHNLWDKYFNVAKSLLFGYIVLQAKYDKLVLQIREENFNKGIYSYQNNFLERLAEKNEELIKDIIEDKIIFKSLDIDTLDFFSLNTVLRLIPLTTDSKEHKAIVISIIERFASSMLSDEDDEKIDYTVKHKFLEKYSCFVLSQPQNEIQNYLLPFIEKFNKSEVIADLFKEFVLAEDILNTYDNFWYVWSVFKEKVFNICNDGDSYWYVDKIVRSYIFAEIPWKATAKDWHTFKDTNKRFFKEVSEKIGHCPSCLYSISKLLNDIGTPYIEDGITWLSTILVDKEYINKKLETNTIYYIELFMKRYIYQNREKIRTTNILKNKVLIVLNFLVEKGSVIGYMLRENIL